MEWKNLINKRNKIDGLDLLSLIPDNTLTVVFFDPQYRGVLDKLSYGNEGKSRGKDRCDLTQMPEDIIKKYKFQGHPLDEEHAKLELGDILWYVNEMAVGLGIDLEEVAWANIKKLRARYGEKFDSQKSQNRKEGDI